MSSKQVGQVRRVTRDELRASTETSYADILGGLLMMTIACCIILMTIKAYLG